MLIIIHSAALLTVALTSPSSTLAQSGPFDFDHKFSPRVKSCVVQLDKVPYRCDSFWSIMSPDSGSAHFWYTDPSGYAVGFNFVIDIRKPRNAQGYQPIICSA